MPYICATFWIGSQLFIKNTDFENMPTTVKHGESTKLKPKKKYSPATLTAYVSIADMTRSGSYVGNEGEGSCTGGAQQGSQQQCS